MLIRCLEEYVSCFEDRGRFIIDVAEDEDHWLKYRKTEIDPSRIQFVHSYSNTMYLFLSKSQLYVLLQTVVYLQFCKGVGIDKPSREMSEFEVWVRE